MFKQTIEVIRTDDHNVELVFQSPSALDGHGTHTVRFQLTARVAEHVAMELLRVALDILYNKDGE